MGLVTVALLTLAPLALRPVRLACLIHAANVHSEPGSNPSKMSRSPANPRIRGDPPAPGPHPKGLRKNTGRTAAPRCDRPTTSIPARPRGATRSADHPPHRTHEERVPVLASHPDASSRGPTGPGCPHNRSHAGFPQGFLTRRILTFVSLCLADECYRPNCQRESTPTYDGFSELFDGLLFDNSVDCIRQPNTTRRR